MSIGRRRFRPLRALIPALLAVVPLPLLAQSPAPPPASPHPSPDPESPLADIADFGVDWPNMQASAEPAETPVAVIEQTSEDGERPYSVRIEGLDRSNATPVRERFDSLSSLLQDQRRAANTAQIDRRIRDDEELLRTILRASGHYDAEVETVVENGPTGALIVLFTVSPGPVYRFNDVNVSGLESTGELAPLLSATFGVEENDVVDADDITQGREALIRILRDRGYPFASVTDPDVTVDHETRGGTMSVRIETGGMRRFGDIRVVGENPPFGATHVATIARFRPGDPYDQARVDDLKRALVATGLVGASDVTPIPGSSPEMADIQVRLEPAPLRTIAGEGGYGTGEGLRVEASWTHRNLIRPEGAVTIRGVAGTREQLAGVIVRQSNFRKRDHVFNAHLLASNVGREAYDARSIELAANLERQSNIIWQKRWTWSVGGEFLASDERDITSGVARRQTYLIGALPLTLGYDRSNDLLDPARGFRLGLRIAPEIALHTGNRAYVRTQFDASVYLPATERVIIAGRVRVGNIAGAPVSRIAPSRRFYSGGGGSVRGFGYQAIGPRDTFNDPIGGRSLAEFALEARIRFGDFGVVPFVDAGNTYAKSLPDFSGLRFGAGLGFRYHSSFGPIRIDVGTPINPQRGDPPVTVFISLGQAF